MIRSFKYRLYPTRAQIVLLYEHLDLTRELYNAALQERRDAWRSQKKSISLFDQMKALPSIREVRSEFKRVGILPQRGVLRRLDRTFAAFYRRCKSGETPGYPRFKGKGHFDSIQIDDLPTSPIVAGGKRLAVPILGKIKIKLHRPLVGKPKALQIKREGDGNWYAILACTGVPEQLLPATGKFVGIDLGLTKLVTTSDGVSYANHRAAEKSRIRLERAQRRVSRRQRGSKRRRKAVVLLRRAHHHVEQVRRQHAIDVANDLIRKYDLIAVEKLNVKGLGRGRLSKQVHDAAWSTLTHWIHVKAESAGREIVEVDPRNTSQMCSGCGRIVKKDLSVRTHRCLDCGLVLDRDENAGRNILALGLSVRRAAVAVGAQL